MNKLTYTPWVPREGMRGWFRHLVAAWGDPNNWDGLSKWPKATIEAVCERGTPQLLRYDRHAESRYRASGGTETR